MSVRTIKRNGSLTIERQGSIALTQLEELGSAFCRLSAASLFSYLGFLVLARVVVPLTSRAIGAPAAVPRPCRPWPRCFAGVVLGVRAST